MTKILKKLCFAAWLFTSNVAICQVPTLSSYTTGAPTLFLDFDGQTVQSAGWRGGIAFVCDAAPFNSAQITEIFNRVSEDFRPFTINITTDSTKFFAAPPTRRARIIITPTSSWYAAGAGGTSYNKSFTWGNDIPSFVFCDRLNNNIKYVAECCSHESGHTLDLSHQSKYNASCGLVESYNSGLGSGETGWAPVMGNGYYRNMTGWNDGPTYDCATLQDNLSIITSAENGVSYRADDYPETFSVNTFNLNPVAFNVGGIITTQTDKDAFKINLTESSTMHIDATPYQINAGNDGANLDIALLLYNSAQTLIRTYNPIDKMNAILDTTLNAGTYYLVVAGTGNNNTTNYGSLGAYTLTGSKGALPIHDVALRGTSNKNEHALSWNIISDEPIVKQVIEASNNGRDFASIFTDITGVKNFSYTATAKETIFYRLKATSSINQTVYSNIIALKTTDSKKLFDVTTIAQQSIRVIATENYSYNLFDANARLVSTGKGKIGIEQININNLSSGMFILQMMSNNNIQTERIIKQ
jgi:hypothetical protein